MRAKPAIALIEFFLTETEITLFLVRSVQPALKIQDQEPLVFRIPFDRTSLRQIAQQFHREIAAAFTPAEVEQIDLANFFDLGKKIFNPQVINALAGFDSLYLVPFGELHHLPLHAFRISDQYLIDLFTIAYLPTATLLAYLPPNETVSYPRKLLAVGVDHYNQRKHFHIEAREVAELEIWASSDLLIREHARRANISEAANGKDVLHFSTHGHFFYGDALLSGISLYASAEEQVKFSKTDFREPAEFYLSARSIMREFKLNAELMVISGCVTGQTEISEGDEPFGLYRSLLYAGARSIIVTLFPIFKNVTARVRPDPEQPAIADFYEYWLNQQASKAEALRYYIRKIKAHPEYVHPAYWCPFIYIGRI